MELVGQSIRGHSNGYLPDRDQLLATLNSGQQKYFRVFGNGLVPTVSEYLSVNRNSNAFIHGSSHIRIKEQQMIHELSDGFSFELNE